MIKLDYDVSQAAANVAAIRRKSRTNGGKLDAQERHKLEYACAILKKAGYEVVISLGSDGSFERAIVPAPKEGEGLEGFLKRCESASDGVTLTFSPDGSKTKRVEQGQYALPTTRTLENWVFSVYGGWISAAVNRERVAKSKSAAPAAPAAPAAKPTLDSFDEF